MSFASTAMYDDKFEEGAFYNAAVGEESLIVEEAYENFVSHYLAPLTRQWANPSIRFLTLKNAWEAETTFLSTARDICLNSNYQQIVGMGPVAIPLILNEMQRNMGHWFWALNAITGEDPVRFSHKGNMEAMTNDWLAWGKSQGYLK